MKGYKAFNADWTCRGKQYKVGETFEEAGEPEVCKRGIHFCENISDVFGFYPFDEAKTKVAEVEAIGEIKKSAKKCCTDKITIIREIPWNEVLKLCNSGNCNSGNCNSGNCNSGNWNSGNCNSGDWNSGNCNSGNRNSGNRNSGYCNSGNWNSGYCNSGNRNSGDWNSGYCNSGYRNSGNWNSGYCNSGYRNSGDWNSGNCNSGEWNSGDWNSGCFCTDKNPKIMLFDKMSDWTHIDWMRSDAARILRSMPNYKLLAWINEKEMTEKEKKEHPEYATAGGFLKMFAATREDRQAWWDSLPDDDKKEVLSIPNFDADKFEECTGIDVRQINGGARNV